MDKKLNQLIKILDEQTDLAKQISLISIAIIKKLKMTPETEREKELLKKLPGGQTERTITEEKLIALELYEKITRRGQLTNDLMKSIEANSLIKKDIKRLKRKIFFRKLWIKISGTIQLIFHI